MIAFNNLVDAIYKLPLNERVELQSLLEHNIADTRRNEIALHYKKSAEEHKAGKLKFSSDIQELKKMI